MSAIDAANDFAQCVYALSQAPPTPAKIQVALRKRLKDAEQVLFNIVRTAPATELFKPEHSVWPILYALFEENAHGVGPARNTCMTILHHLTNRTHDLLNQRCNHELSAALVEAINSGAMYPFDDIYDFLKYNTQYPEVYRAVMAVSFLYARELPAALSKWVETGNGPLFQCRYGRWGCDCVSRMIDILTDDSMRFIMTSLLSSQQQDAAADLYWNLGAFVQELHPQENPRAAALVQGWHQKWEPTLRHFLETQ